MHVGYRIGKETTLARQLYATYRHEGAPMAYRVELNGCAPSQALKALNSQRDALSGPFERIPVPYARAHCERVFKAYYNRDTGYVQDFRTGEVIR